MSGTVSGDTDSSGEWRLCDGEQEDNHWRPPVVFDHMATCLLPDGAGSAAYSPFPPPAEAAPLQVICYGGSVKPAEARSMGLPEGSAICGVVWALTARATADGELRYSFEKLPDQEKRAHHTAVAIGQDVWAFGGLRSLGFQRRANRVPDASKRVKQCDVEEQLSTDPPILCFRPGTGDARSLNALGTPLPPMYQPAATYAASTGMVTLLGGGMVPKVGKGRDAPPCMLYTYHLKTNMMRAVELLDAPRPAPNWWSAVAHDDRGVVLHEAAVLNRSAITTVASHFPRQSTYVHGLFYASFAGAAPDLAPPAPVTVGRSQYPMVMKASRPTGGKVGVAPLTTRWQVLDTAEAPGLDEKYAPPSKAVQNAKRGTMVRPPKTLAHCTARMRHGGFVMNAEAVWRYRPSSFAAHPPSSARFKYGVLTNPPLNPVEYYLLPEQAEAIKAAETGDGEGDGEVEEKKDAKEEKSGLGDAGPAPAFRVLCLCSGPCGELVATGKKRLHHKANLHLHEVRVPALLDARAPIYVAEEEVEALKEETLESAFLDAMRSRGDELGDAVGSPPAPAVREKRKRAADEAKAPKRRKALAPAPAAGDSPLLPSPVAAAAASPAPAAALFPTSPGAPADAPPEAPAQLFPTSPVLSPEQPPAPALLDSPPAPCADGGGDDSDGEFGFA
eukprot:TRINITY_DN20231_c0_g1_i1.p1 TRINITY_DN20231_c0_g1~~TRINITY_DN20231_c0_g1_i1.p1  ORF type:complete len:672 (+),score=217.83 TRINITY_DN20231_c0_g1_i1:84-2099(+)